MKKLGSMQRAQPSLPPRRAWRLAVCVVLAVFVAALAASGCEQWIAHAIVDAPNAGRIIDPADDPPVQSANQTRIARSLRVEVGPPVASLSIWMIDSDHDASQGAPRGTVLVLHGIRDNKQSQVGTGLMLAQAGYRAVLVDLRGHGRSSGDWLTYGVVESRDLVQVLDELERQRLLVKPVSAWGSSYGAAVAIQHAAIDPRIQAIVAVAPFANLSELAPSYADQMDIGWLISQSTIDRAIDRAGRLASFDPSDASPLIAIAQTQASVLLIHGGCDEHIPCDHSRRLHEASPGRTTLKVIDDADHDSIMWQPRAMGEALAWLNETMPH